MSGPFPFTPGQRPKSPVQSRRVGSRGAPRSQVIQGLQSSDLAPPSLYDGASGALIPRYPISIDDVPDFQDNVSPAVGLWLNLLQQLVEAVQAEVGPLPSGIFRPHAPINEEIVRTLKDLLGQQSDAALTQSKSRAGLCSAIAGNGKPAGTLYGVQRIQVTRTDWSGEYTSTVVNPFGYPPRLKLPIFWGYGRRPANESTPTFSYGDTGVCHIAGLVETQAAGSPSTSVNYTIRYCASTARSPGGSTSIIPGVRAAPGITADLCLIYMTTEDDAQ